MFRRLRRRDVRLLQGSDRWCGCTTCNFSFFFSLLAFGLFFVEYQIFQGMTKRDLNVSLGYLQALGCTLLVLCGLWGIYYSTRQGPVAATSSAGFPETILLIIYIFGHAVFVANIVWSYLAERRTA